MSNEVHLTLLLAHVILLVPSANSMEYSHDAVYILSNIKESYEATQRVTAHSRFVFIIFNLWMGRTGITTKVFYTLLVIIKGLVDQDKIIWLFMWTN